MPKKAEHTIHIHEGEAVLYQRVGSPHWQLRYKANGKWARATTKKTKLADAKSEAMEIIVRARVLEKEGLLVTSKRVTTVAKLAIKRMEAELDSGNGKVTYKRYIQAINGYVIPLLGRHNVDKIDYNVLAIYSNERKQLMNQNRTVAIEPSQSVINTHNVALNRVFDEALIRGFMTKSQVPHLENRGVSSDRRPTFTAKEYIKIYTNFETWTNSARKGNETLLRNVLANYILILANTGIRAGTEAMNLKWQHISIEDVKGQRMVTVYVSGKANPRKIYVPASVAKYLNRIKEQYEDIKDLTFYDLIDKKLNKYVFRIKDKDATTKLGKVFARYLTSLDLLIDKETEQARTLYSLRHFYATKMLIKGISGDLLAEHMGTSATMIKKHYGHLNLRDIATKFTGLWKIEDELEREDATLIE
jgi:site-specific recombinase XerD